MGDDTDQKERVKAVLEGKDTEAAVGLLTADDAYSIGKGERNRLAALAIKGAYIAPYYSKVVGLVSGDVEKSLSEDLGRYGSPEMVFEILEDPYHKKQHAAILSGAITNEKIRTARLYASVINSVSDETKDVLNTALGRDVQVTNEELVAILGDTKFVAQRRAIFSHLRARMSADELDKLGEELRPILSAEEIVQWNEGVAYRRAREAEHGQHGSSAHDTGGDSDSVALWVFLAILALILLSVAP